MNWSNWNWTRGGLSHSRHIDRISGPFLGRNLHWETWRCDFANKASQISGGQHSLWIEQELRYSRKRGLPSAKDAIRCYPLRSSSCTLWGLSIDIKSAHKLVKLRPSERGLVSFPWCGKNCLQGMPIWCFFQCSLVGQPWRIHSSNYAQISVFGTFRHALCGRFHFYSGL